MSKCIEKSNEPLLKILIAAHLNIIDYLGLRNDFAVFRKEVLVQVA